MRIFGSIVMEQWQFVWDMVLPSILMFSASCPIRSPYLWNHTWNHAFPCQLWKGWVLCPVAPLKDSQKSTFIDLCSSHIWFFVLSWASLRLCLCTTQPRQFGKNFTFATFTSNSCAHFEQIWRKNMICISYQHSKRTLLYCLLENSSNADKYDLFMDNLKSIFAPEVCYNHY